MVQAKIGKGGIVLIAPISIPDNTGSNPVLTTKLKIMIKKLIVWLNVKYWSFRFNVFFTFRKLGL
jgi:hypothetical protein